MNIHYLETTHSGQSTPACCTNPPRVSGPVLKELRVKNISWHCKIIPESLGLHCSSHYKPTQAEKEKFSCMAL